MKIIDGKQVAEDGETIKVARDDHAVRVPLMLMDHRPEPIAIAHKPGFLPTNAADRAALDVAQVVREKKLSDAWRNPPPLDVPAAPSPRAPITPTALTSDQRYAARDKRLEDAWRQA